MWVGNFTFWQIPAKKNNYNYVKGLILTDSYKKNNYDYVDRFQTKKIITTMWNAIYYLLRGQKK